MERKRREPGWVGLYHHILTNPKIAALTDSEFRAWAYTLAASALEPHKRGWFDDRSYLAAIIGRRRARHIESLIGKGVLETDGERIRVHDFEKWNPPTVDPTAPERMARLRDNDRRESEGLPRVDKLGRIIPSKRRHRNAKNDDFGATGAPVPRSDDGMLRRNVTQIRPDRLDEIERAPIACDECGEVMRREPMESASAILPRLMDHKRDHHRSPSEVTV